MICHWYEKAVETPSSYEGGQKWVLLAGHFAYISLSKMALLPESASGYTKDWELNNFLKWE